MTPSTQQGPYFLITKFQKKGIGVSEEVLKEREGGGRKSNLSPPASRTKTVNLLIV